MKTWIFQGNPDIKDAAGNKVDVAGNVGALDKWDWDAPKKQMEDVKKGDRAYIWVSGKDAGIIASGTISCDPETREDKNMLTVDIEFDRKFISSKVSRNILRDDKRTKGLKILEMPRATVFPVTEEEEKVIRSIIDGTYVQVPIAGAKEEIMEEYTKLLKISKNLILTGAPGTGKTYLAKELASILVFGKKEAELNDAEISDFKKCHAFVQFHPSYDYTDFVEGLRPTKPDAGNIGFELKDGIFKAFCKEALNNKDRRYVFIIDEINRGEISKIFGELFFSIEPSYRGEKGKVKTQYSQMQSEKTIFDPNLGKGWFYVPENVYIIGTMNDIDRSVESFDFAMRRRFIWKEITAEDSANAMKLPESVKTTMKRLNDAMSNIAGLNSSYHVGGAYFLAGNENPAESGEDLWKYRLEPLLREYLRGRPDAEQEMENLRNAFFKTETADARNEND